MEDKDGRSRFFKEIFLLADISIDIALNMPFFILNDVKIDFVNCHIHWRSDTIVKVLPTIRQVKLIGKKEIATITLDLEDEVIIVNVDSISSNMAIYLFWRAQIALLKADETSTLVPSKYADFADVISKDLAAGLSEYAGINNHAINLIKRQEPFYRSIYSLDPVELETL